MAPKTLFPTSKGWKGKDLIAAAEQLGYIHKRQTGDHHILEHPQLKDTVVIPDQDDLRRTDSQIVKQLRRTERLLIAQKDLPGILKNFPRNCANRSIGSPVPPKHIDAVEPPQVCSTPPPYEVRPPYVPQTQPQEPVMVSHPIPTSKAQTRIELPWNKWLRTIRDESQLSQPEVAELMNMSFHKELLGLVERGIRKFSQAEYEAWRKIFDITTEYPSFPLATLEEQRKRDIYNRSKKPSLKKAPVKKVSKAPAKVRNTMPLQFHPQNATSWNTWVAAVRLAQGLTQASVISMMNLDTPFSTQDLSKIEKGLRLFKAHEWDVWNKTVNFDKVTPFKVPIKVPLAVVRETPVQEIRHTVDPKLIENTPKVIPMKVVSLRESLVDRATKILMNQRLTDEEVTKLLTNMRDSAVTLLGIE